MTAPLGGFGGYDPNNPPPGYDASCWRATNWDTGHGLQCYAPKHDTLKNTYNTLTPTQRSTADTLLAQYDDPTMLLTDVRKWLPWTRDFGNYPPPPNSLWSYLFERKQVLPWPGVLTQQQSVALYQALQPVLGSISHDDFNALVAKVKRDYPANPDQLGWIPANPTPTVTTTFSDGTVYDGTTYTKPDGTTYTTAAEAGLGPQTPPAISGPISPAPTTTGISGPTSIAPPTVVAIVEPLNPSPIPGITTPPTVTAVPNATVSPMPTPTSTLPSSFTMTTGMWIALGVGALVVIYFASKK